MRKVSVSLLALAAAVLCASTSLLAAPQPLLTRHTREAVTSGEAKIVGRLPESQTLHFDVMLALRHQPELDNFLKELYDPASPSYKHYVTVEEFADRFGASREDYAALLQFGHANGFTLVKGSLNRMDVQFTATVGTIEKAFNVALNVYQHPTEDRTFFALDREPTADLAVQLWHISGLDNYSIPKPLLAHSQHVAQPLATTGSGPDDSFLGSDMRAAYYEGTALTGTGQSIGLLEYAGTDLEDLDTYYKNVKQTLNVPITLDSVDGTSVNCTADEGCDDTEQTIDMTQSLGMAPNLASLVMYIGSTDSAIFNAMATASPLNAQLSCSWYWSPADPSTLNPIFQEFASQGQNLFDAAGDHESWQIGGSIWPADNAYLTSVGGTDLLTQGPGDLWAEETAWSDGGGGYSPNGIPIPSWQVTTAAGCKDCSQTLRNGPDVSGNSNFTYYVCADQTSCSANEYGGTSFAAPMWAGYLALANEQAVAAGQATLGFINPALYNIGLSSSYHTDFHDITIGSNGYPAGPGYDLATGWGSPNSNGLLDALTGAGNQPLVFPYPASLAWKNVVVGATGPKKTVTVTNTGASSLTISSITVSAEFALVTLKATKTVTPCASGLTLAPAASCKIELTFDPTQTGPQTGDLTINDTASGSPQQVALSGTGKS
jgi:subtilase family serine protease